MPPDPIRGRWTIGPGGYFEGDPNDPSYAGWHVNGPALHEPVEVVPVPDEQAIERAANAARLTFNDETLSLATLWPAIARAVLTDALEKPA